MSRKGNGQPLSELESALMQEMRLLASSIWRHRGGISSEEEFQFRLEEHQALLNQYLRELRGEPTVAPLDGQARLLRFCLDAVAPALRQSLYAHPAITRQNQSSAAKRIRGSIWQRAQRFRQQRVLDSTPSPP